MEMTQEEIAVKHNDIVRRRRELQLELEDLQDTARALMRRCSHPDAYDYTAMGDPGRKCPDCGWAT